MTTTGRNRVLQLPVETDEMYGSFSSDWKARETMLGGRKKLRSQNCAPTSTYLTSTSFSQSGRFKTSRGLLPSGGPMMPSRCIISNMRAARP